MGCDYYIIRGLEIVYLDDGDDEHYTFIELTRTREYFYHEDDSSVDSDDSDYNSRLSNQYNKYLTVTYNPRVLFENNNWKNKDVQDKYESTILEHINNGLIVSVKKVEQRYLT